jgi:hypothetical protein
MNVNKLEDTFHCDLWNNIRSLLDSTSQEKNHIKIIELVMIALSKPCFMGSNKSLFVPLNGTFFSPLSLDISRNDCIHVGFNDRSFAENYWSLVNDLINKIYDHKECIEIVSQFVRGDGRTKVRGIITSAIENQLREFAGFYKLPLIHADDIMGLFEKEEITSFCLQEHSFNGNTYITSIYRLGNNSPYSEIQSVYFKSVLTFLYRVCFFNGVLSSCETYRHAWVALLHKSNSGLYNDEAGFYNYKSDFYLRRFNKFFRKNNSKFPPSFTVKENFCSYRFYWMEFENIHSDRFEYRMPIVAVIGFREDDVDYLSLIDSSIYSII